MRPLSNRTPQHRGVTGGPAGDGSGGDTEAEHFVNGCVEVGNGCGEDLGGGWERVVIQAGVFGSNGEHSAERSAEGFLDAWVLGNKFDEPGEGAGCGLVALGGSQFQT